MVTEMLPSGLSLVLMALVLCAVVAGKPENVRAESGRNDTGQLAEFERRQKLAEAEKAALEAEKNLINEKIGKVDDSGIGGETTLATTNSDAGKAEAMLLGAVALNEIADRFADQISRDIPQGATLLLFPSSERLDFDALRAFNVSYEIVMKHRDKRESLEGKGDTGRSLLPWIGPAADLTKNLLSLFKTDYTFYSIGIESTDAMMLDALSNSLRKKYAGTITLRRPGAYRPDVGSMPSVLMDKLMELELLAGTVPAADSLLKNLENVDTETKRSGFSAVVEQAVLFDAINQQNTYIVKVESAQAAGSMYTKKNLWSSIGSNPFHVMGGAVASYAAYEGSSGIVVSSLLVPVHGGYQSVSKIRKFIENPKD